MSSSNGNGGGAKPARDPETDRARLRAIHEAASAGEIERAGKLAEDALGDGIDHVLVLSLAAGRREAEGRFADALELLQRAKAAAPRAPGILNALGLNLLWLGRAEEAAAEFDAALAADPGFAPALANRGTALVALARLNAARRDFEAALALEPGNLVALNGLASLALRRGDPDSARELATRVTARQPDYPDALMTLAGADLAEGQPAIAESRLRVLLRDRKLPAPDRALAQGLLGDALDAEGRFGEAFAAWRAGNALRAEQAADHAGRTLGLVRELTGALAGRRVAATWGRGGGGPARRHVFLVGFPRSGATLVEQVLAAHPEVTILAERECLVDAARAWLADAADIAQFCAAPDEDLDAHRDAYWRRVAAAGAEPAGRVFVDKHGFNIFKLPLIARLFPEARVLVARRDPRDTVLSCFATRFAMSEPAHQLLTLEGAAELYAATMELAEATERAFGLFVQPCRLEAMIADFDAETKAICTALGIEWLPELRDFHRQVAARGVATPGAARLTGGLSAAGIGRWRDYEGEMAPVLPALQPWIERFGYA
ncbi:MAG TPA: sulfotransferase [Allosphingosinicella sp.]|nr:sulfotransferase [Allosphingosinicella sp.]